MNLITGPATKYTTMTFGAITSNQVLENGASVIVHSMVFTTVSANRFPVIFQADGTTKIFVPYISGTPNNQTWETIGPILADKGISISSSDLKVYIFYSRVGA